jgi:hypothetical protein
VFILLNLCEAAYTWYPLPIRPCRPGDLPSSIKRRARLKLWYLATEKSRHIPKLPWTGLAFEKILLKIRLRLLIVGNIFGESLLAPCARVPHHPHLSKPVSRTQFCVVPFCFATRAKFLAQKRWILHRCTHNYLLQPWCSLRRLGWAYKGMRQSPRERPYARQHLHGGDGEKWPC